MMEFKQKILVLYAQRYSITDKETGKLVEGVSVKYLNEPESGSINQSDKEGDSIGQQPVDATLPLAAWDSLPAVPGLYDAIFTMSTKKDSVSKKIVQVVKPIGAKFLGRVSLFQVVGGAPPAPQATR